MGNSKTMVLDGAGATMMRASRQTSTTSSTHIVSNSGAEKYGTGAPKVRSTPQTSSSSASSGSKK